MSFTNSGVAEGTSLARCHVELANYFAAAVLMPYQPFLEAAEATGYDIDRIAHHNLPDWAYGLGSFSRDRVVAASAELGLAPSAVIGEEIATVTWEDVRRAFGPRRCDLLILDTEGYDLTLLRAAGLAAWSPTLIHFEHACVSEDDRLAFYRELVGFGYEIATEGQDTTAWRAR